MEDSVYNNEQPGDREGAALAYSPNNNKTDTPCDCVKFYIAMQIFVSKGQSKVQLRSVTKQWIKHHSMENFSSKKMWPGDLKVATMQYGKSTAKRAPFGKL